MYNYVPVLKTDQAGDDGHHRTVDREKNETIRIYPWRRTQLQLEERNLEGIMSFSDLRSPSGSKGAWHHEGASGGSGPFCGESMLHCCHRREELIQTE